MKLIVVFAFVLAVATGRNNVGYKARFGLPLDTDPASPGIPNDYSGDEVFMWKTGRSLWQHNRISFDDANRPRPTYHEVDSMNRRPNPFTSTIRAPRPVPTAATPKPSLTTRPTNPVPKTKLTPATIAPPKITPRPNRPTPPTKPPGGKRTPKTGSKTTVMVDDENYSD